MIGTQVLQFRILEKLGEGGMGEVFLAEDTRLKRRVALKFLPPHFSRDPEFKARFEHEAIAAAALNHPNIITVHDLAEHDDRLFITMEYVEGRSLEELIVGGDLPLDRTIELACQICEGLGKAHQAGIVHRDIKPSNILVDSDGRAKILDFGLAKSGKASALTKTGTTLGTLRYESPEQALGQPADARSDLFSLGAVLYEMITGRTPFAGETEPAVRYAITHETPEPLARYKSGVPNELQRVMSKLLEKDLDLRYQSAAGIKSDLKRITAAETEAASGTRSDWWNRFVVTGAAVVLLVLAAIWLIPKWGQDAVQVSEPTRKMLAVLPFENLGDPEDEYFADGMTEEITARLAAVGELGVIARSSIVQYKGTTKPIGQIGEELGVDYILEGTVRWQRAEGAPGRVRVTPQLIRVEDATHTWAEVYDRILAEVFAVQTDIANQIVEALDLALLEPERRLLESQPTDDPEAFDYLLRGNEYFGPLSYLEEKELKLAAGFYQQAIERDPEFAMAYAKLSRVYTELYWHHDRPEEDLVRARELVDRALELDDGLPEARIALGSFYYHRQEYERALREFRIARRVQPNNTVLLSEMGHALRRQGQTDSCVACYERVVALDPRSTTAHANLGVTCQWMRRYDLAEASYDRAIDLAPHAFVPYTLKAWIQVLRDGDPHAAQRILQAALEVAEWSEQWPEVRRLIYASTGDYNRALQEAAVKERQAPGCNLYRQAQIYGLMGDSVRELLYYDSARIDLEEELAGGAQEGRYHTGLGIAYAGLGRVEDAISEGELGVEKAPIMHDAILNTRYEYELAMIYTMVGDYDAAIAELEKLLAVPAFVSVHSLQVFPIWAPLRDHPRFEALLRKGHRVF
jgi:TolB-like protein/Tfp pilus assembly protein PilF/predicted Ser/Thr protein kinase